MSVLRSGRFAPLPAQAPITGKGLPDSRAIESHRRSGQDGNTQNVAYPGATDKDNFFIMPGELLIGKKAQNNPYANGSFEIGITSVAGMPIKEKNLESTMRDWYLIGVVTTEWELEGENMYGQEALDHGFGFQRAGSCTINNNSAEDIYPGDWLEWTFPKHNQISNKGLKKRIEIDNGFNPLSSRNRMGTPFKKPLIEIKRFDPNDFSLNLSAYTWQYKHLISEGGCSDMTFDQYENHKDLYSSLQLEAFAWTRGILCISHTVNDKAVDFMDNGGKLVDKKGKSLNDVVVLNNLFEQFDFQSSTSVPTVGFGDTKYAQQQALNLLTAGVCGTAMAKMSRVIGKAMGGARPSESLDMVLMSLKIGF